MCVFNVEQEMLRCLTCRGCWKPPPPEPSLSYGQGKFEKHSQR